MDQGYGGDLKTKTKCSRTTKKLFGLDKNREEQIFIYGCSTKFYFAIKCYEQVSPKDFKKCLILEDKIVNHLRAMNIEQCPMIIYNLSVPIIFIDA